jgi:hypothetical protein
MGVCWVQVGWLLEKGEQGSAAHLMPPLLERIRVLVYNGEYDMDCNFVGEHQQPLY